MDFFRIYDDGLAQAAYLIGCGRTGEALVVDPLRDVDRYIRFAREHDFEIVAVAETHIHADFLSGARELAAQLDAMLYVSGEAPDDWTYRGLDELRVTRLTDGERFAVGHVELRARHTPGHTPEHLSLLVLGDGQPRFALTGDFVFVGDLGRPDLLEETRNADQGASKRWARRMFESLEQVFCDLDDGVVVWPGHGAGSSCGKSMAAIPATSAGWERERAWWAEAVATGDVDAFVDQLLADQPETPTYFGRMKRLNRDGPPLLGGLAEPGRLLPKAARRALDAGAQLVDLRNLHAFAREHVAGAIGFPNLGSLSEQAGWVLDPLRPIVVLCDAAQRDEAVRRLIRVGLDDIVGWVEHPDEVPGDRDAYPVIDAARARQLRQRHDAVILDVRARSEWDAGHICGAVHIHYGKLAEHLDRLARDRPLVVHCASGVRTTVALSVLQAHGFDPVYNFAGGFDAWQDAGFDTTCEG